jgi:hypothetical protein
MERREQAKVQIEKAQEEQLLRDGIERLKKRFGTLEIRDCLDDQHADEDQQSSSGSIDHLTAVNLNHLTDVPSFDHSNL